MMRPAFNKSFTSPHKSFKTTDTEEQKLVTLLEREMVQQNPGINWTDIAGKQIFLRPGLASSDGKVSAS